MKKIIFLVACLFVSLISFGQKDPLSTYPVSKYEPLTLKISEDGTKYIRFIMWHQIWATTQNMAIEDSKFQANVSIRRSRFLAYAQISPKFLILTHWGLNGLSTNNMSSLGNNADAPQLFLHGAWGEIKLSESDAVYVGGGLHYWRGLTRLSSQSTLNFMTLDQSRPFVQWNTLGITDQFARHMGIYAKGRIGNLDYRVAVNNPMNPINSLGGGVDFSNQSDLIYAGSSTPDQNGDPQGNMIYEGHFSWSFFDKESIKLPYRVGTYMGNKKVLNVGLGFFAHPKGMYNTVDLSHENLLHLAADVFFDQPLGENNALNVYASVINFNYGENYMSRWAGTGTNIYGQVGYYLGKFRSMPYIAYQTGMYDAFQDNLNALNVGVNYFLNGHNAKLTAEYHAISNNPLEGGLDADGNPNGVQQIRLQLHIFL